jgi:hypothetical protein
MASQLWPLTKKNWEGMFNLECFKPSSRHGMYKVLFLLNYVHGKWDAILSILGSRYWRIVVRASRRSRRVPDSNMNSIYTTISFLSQYDDRGQQFFSNPTRWSAGQIHHAISTFVSIHFSLTMRHKPGSSVSSGEHFDWRRCPTHSDGMLLISAILMASIQLVLHLIQHGYTSRLLQSLRFVYVVTDKGKQIFYPQLYQDEKEEGVLALVRRMISMFKYYGKYGKQQGHHDEHGMRLPL